MNFWDELPKPFLCLAPMEGVTDWVFREVVKKAGAPDVMFTEFTNVSSFASDEGRANALERLRPTEGVKTVAQIWGKNPDHFATTARSLAALGFAGLDINMGCPDRHVIRAGGGSAMILNPELASECVAQAKAATDLPISVKTRLGYSEVNEFRTWLPFLLRLDLSALTIHLRTKKEMSKVVAHYELISEIVAMRNEIAPKTKLIVNGDIKDRTEALRLCAANAGVDGAMIGRGVFENVFCFTDYQPTQDDLRDLFLYHLDLFDKDGQQKFEPLKHFYKVYFKGFDGAKELREKMMGAKTTDELRATLSDMQREWR